MGMYVCPKLQLPDTIARLITNCYFYCKYVSGLKTKVDNKILKIPPIKETKFHVNFNLNILDGTLAKISCIKFPSF